MAVRKNQLLVDYLLAVAVRILVILVARLGGFTHGQFGKNTETQHSVLGRHQSFLV